MGTSTFVEPVDSIVDTATVIIGTSNPDTTSSSSTAVASSSRSGWGRCTSHYCLVMIGEEGAARVAEAGAKAGGLEEGSGRRAGNSETDIAATATTSLGGAEGLAGVGRSGIEAAVVEADVTAGAADRKIGWEKKDWKLGSLQLQPGRTSRELVQEKGKMSVALVEGSSPA